MIEIIDYGAGNLRSVLKGLEAVGAEVRLCSDPAALDSACGVVFPGQGAFETSADQLEKMGFVEPLRRYIQQDRPYLGICLGLQLLFETSHEAPGKFGLGIFKGGNQTFKPGKKIPLMGWNSVHWKKNSNFNLDLPQDSFFYFVHSYFPVPDDPEIIAGITDYEEPFCSAIQRGNLAAVQFHPEKSQKMGLGLLKNFVDLCQKKG